MSLETDKGKLSALESRLNDLSRDKVKLVKRIKTAETAIETNRLVILGKTIDGFFPGADLNTLSQAIRDHKSAILNVVKNKSTVTEKGPASDQNGTKPVLSTETK
jgi:hypothetical protein